MADTKLTERHLDGILIAALKSSDPKVQMTACRIILDHAFKMAAKRAKSSAA